MRKINKTLFTNKLIPVFLILFILIRANHSRAEQDTASITDQNVFAHAKYIALNFDDGPKHNILIKHLLPVLNRHKVPGTFFVVGAEIKSEKNLLLTMYKQGHEIESHGWGHENFIISYKLKNSTYDKGGVIKSLNRTAEAIIEITGHKPKFFRPPFWSIDKKINTTINELGYTVMNLGGPDINTLDYEDAAHHRSSEDTVRRVMKQIDAREKNKIYRHVLVFHELKLTAEALDSLIPLLKNQGYVFVRLDIFINTSR